MMFDYLNFDENGVKVVSRINGVNADMMMDITVYRLKKGQSVQVCEESRETAILLTEGNVTYSFEDKRENAKRKNVFEEAPYCLHICKGKKATVTAEEDSEVLVQMTENDREFETVFYTPKECKIEVMTSPHTILEYGALK